MGTWPALFRNNVDYAQKRQDDLFMSNPGWKRGGIFGLRLDTETLNTFIVEG